MFDVTKEWEKRTVSNKKDPRPTLCEILENSSNKKR